MSIAPFSGDRDGSTTLYLHPNTVKSSCNLIYSYGLSPFSKLQIIEPNLLRNCRRASEALVKCCYSAKINLLTLLANALKMMGTSPKSPKILWFRRLEPHVPIKISKKSSKMGGMSPMFSYGQCIPMLSRASRPQPVPRGQ